MRRFVLALLASVCLAVPAAAQDEAELMIAQMEAAMAQASAGAARPGDEALSCEQMETELAATLNDPAVQATFAAQGAWAAEQQARMRGAATSAMAMMAPGIIASIMTSFIPGGNYLQQGIAAAQAAQGRAMANQRMAEVRQMASGSMAIMPQLMRGQRLVELGVAKQCAFAADAAAQQADAE